MGDSSLLNGRSDQTSFTRKLRGYPSSQLLILDARFAREMKPALLPKCWSEEMARPANRVGRFVSFLISFPP